MFTVYVLRSVSTSKYYVGQTEDPLRRLQDHQAGLARYTRGRGAWTVALTETYDSRAEPMGRERFLKSGKGREWLRAELEGKAGPPQEH